MRKASVGVVGMSMQMIRGKGEIFVGGREGFVQGRFGFPTSLGREEVVMVSAHTQPPDFRGFFFSVSPSFPLWDSSWAVKLEAGEIQWLTQGYLRKWSFRVNVDQEMSTSSPVSLGNELAECGFLQVGTVGMGRDTKGTTWFVHPRLCLHGPAHRLTGRLSPSSYRAA